MQSKEIITYRVRTPMSARSDQVRLRIREEMERRKLTQREIADILKWSQSRVAKVLTGRVGLDFDDLEALCFAVGLSLVEAVRDHGLEFAAELTPTELRILERYRQLPQDAQQAIMTILDVRAKTRNQERRALPKKPRPAKVHH